MYWLAKYVVRIKFICIDNGNAMSLQICDMQCVCVCVCVWLELQASVYVI